jgi:O-antigen/teichoic acid export membrane protein
LLSVIKKAFRRHFLQGQPRTLKAKRNIVVLFVLRAVSVLVNFILVPLTLNYLNPTKYGIWLTLTSVINWVGVLDIGLGTGLRNKFAEALARDNDDLAKTYVSTAYVFIGVIAAGAIILFWTINPFLNWASILKTGPELRSELGSLARVVFTFFCLRLVFGLIGTLLIANQRPAMSTFLEVLTNIISLFIIYILTRVSSGSLYWLGFVISGVTGLVPLAANFWYFSGKYKRYAPSLDHVNTDYAKQLTGLGVQFFILQLAGIVVFSTSNIIITQFYGPEEVTPFNIAFKYYGVPAMAFLMVLTPFWTAYTDAHVRGDHAWIRRSNKRLIQIWGGLVVAVALMTIVADRVYAIWVGKSVQVPLILSIFNGLYVIIVAWSNIFAYFINGTGKIRLQIYAAVIVSVLNIALAVYFSEHFALRSAGVILATCLALLPGCFLWPVQMKKLLTGTATGIWGK